MLLLFRASLGTVLLPVAVPVAILLSVGLVSASFAVRISIGPAGPSVSRLVSVLVLLSVIRPFLTVRL